MGLRMQLKLPSGWERGLSVSYFVGWGLAPRSPTALPQDLVCIQPTWGFGAGPVLIGLQARLLLNC